MGLIEYLPNKMSKPVKDLEIGESDGFQKME